MPMRFKSSRSSGFTLIEVVVVLSIVGLLMALIIPAVMSARETARLLGCSNNLKQIGIASNSHHAAHGIYPYGTLPNGNLKDGTPFAAPGALSAHAQLLAFLDQTTTYHSINFFANLTFSRQLPTVGSGVENRTARETRIGIFVCPSDAFADGGTHYRAAVGPHPFEHDGFSRPGGGGAYPGLIRISAKDLRDGASQTVGFSERLRGGWAKNSFSQRRDFWLSGSAALGRPLDSDDMIRICDGLTSSSFPFWSFSGEQWILSGFSNTLYNHVTVPNHVGYDCSDHGDGVSDASAISGGSFPARSAHSRGVNTLLMDGSVRFVRNDININVWRAASTRNGNDSSFEP